MTENGTAGILQPVPERIDRGQTRIACSTGGSGSPFPPDLQSNFIEAIERFLNDGLNALDLIVLQWRKFPFAPFFRKRTFILPDEKEEIVSKAVRHFNRIHDQSPRFVVAAQIVYFTRQVILDGSLDAVVQKFRRFRAIEIPVQIGGIVQNFDIAVKTRSKINIFRRVSYLSDAARRKTAQNQRLLEVGALASILLLWIGAHRRPNASAADKEAQGCRSISRLSQRLKPSPARAGRAHWPVENSRGGVVFS
jgi:hypothetical protein